jgi:hypothetical protein
LLFSAADSGIEHGSRFAKTLGFYDDIAWAGEDGDEANAVDLVEISLTELNEKYSMPVVASSLPVGGSGSSKAKG